MPTSTIVPVVTGPGWIDLANLSGDVLSEMARYPGVTPASTKLTIDLGIERSVGVLVIPFHNAKPGDTARIRLYADAALTDLTLDSGIKEFFTEVYPFGSLPWGHICFTDGRATAEQAAGQMPPWIHIAAAEELGRYMVVEFDFSGNADGYVDCGQIIASPSFSPVYNFSFGCNPPYYKDPSVKTRTRNGPEFAEQHRPYRTTRLQFDWLGTNELYGSFYEMVRAHGVTKPMFFIYDSDAEASILPKTSFMARLTTINDPTRKSASANSLTVDVSEAF